MGDVMRKTLTRAAFVVAAVLLAGCGGGGGADESPAESKAKSPAVQPSHTSEDSGDAVEEGTPHEVTIEVRGTGTGSVMYTLDEDNFEQVTLPWKKTATIAARGAERKVGRLVILTPGNVTRPDGKLVAAACSITVDGKTVVETKEGAGKPCSYKFK
ncbi:hypothetical protein AB0I52_10065 [Streptomyces sp. NPDC050423]|uniref:hypothetical protein n=1 Tax=Streptomyces sp. NPDC050423 TaxID=3155402 RepID=UPI003440E0D3